jgi:Protein ChrB, N-terminal
VGWILLTYRLPADDSSRARVAVWRETRRAGALHLQQSVVAFPDSPRFQAAVERFREVVAEVGGETLVVQGDGLEKRDVGRLRDEWNQARDAEYAELVGVADKYLAEIEHEFEIEKFTLAELEEEEQSLDRLRRWFRSIRGRDVFGSPSASGAEANLADCVVALEEFAGLVYQELHS